MTDRGSNDLLEINKLHAELADRVSQRREGANRLYAGLLTAIAIAVAAHFNFGAQDGSMTAIFFITGGVGFGLSVS